MGKKRTPYLLLLPQLLLTALFLWGLGAGLLQSLGVVPAFGLTKPTLHYYKEVLTRPDLAKSLFFSMKIALVSASLATVLGTALCAVLVMERGDKGVYRRIFELPILVPHVVAALFMVNLFSQNGILSRLCFALGFLEEQQQFPRLLYDGGGLGIILAYLWKEIPFILYFVFALMAGINQRLGEAAVNLGAGAWTAFFKVTLPLCRNTILSGFLIIFAFALGAYELPLLLGATMPKALPVLAYQQYMHPDLRNRPYAMALNGIILALSLISAGAYFCLMEKNWKKVGERP